MAQGLPSLQHATEEDFDPAAAAESFDPPVGPLSLDVLRLVLCAAFFGPHLLVLPRQLGEHPGTLSLRLQRPASDALGSVAGCPGDDPGAQ